MNDKDTLKPPEGWVKEGQTIVISSEKPVEETRGEGWMYETQPPERNPAADMLTGAAAGAASKVVNPLTSKAINTAANVISGPMPEGAKPSIYRATTSSPIMNWTKQMVNVADYSPAAEAEHYKDAYKRMMAAEEARKKAEKLQKLENLFKSEEEIRKAATPVKDKILAANKVMTPQAQSLPGKIGRLGVETLGRTVAGGSAAYQGVDAYNRLKRGDIAGAALGGLGAIGSGMTLIPTPATRVVGTGLGLLGGLGTTALDKYREMQKPEMADGGPVQHFFLGGTVGSIAPSIGAISNAVQNMEQSAPQPMPQTTTPIAPTQPTPFVGTQFDERSVPGVQEETGTAVQMFGGTPQGTTPPAPFNPTPRLYGQGPELATNTGGSVVQMFGGMPQQDNNLFTQNNMNPTVGNQPMPRLKQFVPQVQQSVTPRRPTGGGMPTYMQNNAAYEAQRQRMGPYTAFPNANQMMPQRRVVPRRGVPIARMAEGGPVKK